MENALDAEHSKAVLRYAETPGISPIPTLNGGIRAERMASSNKCARNKPNLRLWVGNTDSTSRTNVLPTPHRQKSGPGEKNGL